VSVVTIGIPLPAADLTHADEVALATAIEAGLLAAEARARQSRPDATPAELIMLEELGARAAQRFVEANLRLVAMVSRREAARTGMAQGDLFQEGCLGLLEAVRRYDHRLGLRFATYALHWIRAYVGALSANRGGDLNLPAGRAERARELRGLHSRLVQRLGREATIGELAVEAGRRDDWVARLLAHEPNRSLDDPAQRLPDVVDAGAAADLETVLDTGIPGRELLSRLNPRQRAVIELRYGFVDGRAHSFNEVAQRLGLPASTVRRHEAAALEALRGICPQQAIVHLTA
jgi:RNA polymerase primary sigma factor/RNA polymerase nonessential primary-like sigma factor